MLRREERRAAGRPAPARIAVIGVPSRAGSRSHGLEEAPGRLRAVGLVERLRASGADVADLGDVVPGASRGTTERAGAGSLAAVVAAAHALADRVRLAAADGRSVLVLGGDCTITVGAVAGLSGLASEVALLYVDGDLDLNTPATSPSGFFDGMGAAHLLGRGAPELARIGPRFPLLAEERLAFFGYNERSGFVDAAELEALGRLRSARYPLAEVRSDPLGSAGRALERLAGRGTRLLVHFDVDATDLAAADLPHADALAWPAAVDVLRAAAAARTFSGLVVTELNPRRDPGGASSRRVAEALAEVFGVAAERGRRGVELPWVGVR